MTEVVVYWFRRDLRLEDNTALFHALKSGKQVLPIFIFDPQQIEEQFHQRQINLQLHLIRALNNQLQVVNASLSVYHMPPKDVFENLVQQFDVHAVYWNETYEPDEITRDNHLQQLLKGKGVDVYSLEDQMVFHPKDVLKDDGSPYTVYTPYMKRWRKCLEAKPEALEKRPSQNLLDGRLMNMHGDIPSIEELGFESISIKLPEVKLDDAFLSDYANKRDIPSENGVSRISIALRYGRISIREAMRRSESHFKYMNELIWREFYMMILYHFPHVVSEEFKPKYSRIEWDFNENQLQLWKEGKTGVSFVDAGMRQLNSTGWMHNRMRMITASFLVKNLGMDWRLGEAYFAEQLFDWELSSNNGGWQWVAGTGCDASPYFRVFNPESQQKKFDPKMVFTHNWVDEIESSTAVPIVDLKASRERCLGRYKAFI